MIKFQPNHRTIGASNHDAASYWVTNFHNNYIRNVATGGRGAGFWFETLGAVVGPSAGLPKNDGVICTCLWATMSSRTTGPTAQGRVSKRTSLAGELNQRPLPRRYLLKRNLTVLLLVLFLFTRRKPEETSILEGLVLYKNHNTGIFLHANRNIVVKNLHFADNGNCATHALHNAAPGNFIEDLRVLACHETFMKGSE